MPETPTRTDAGVPKAVLVDEYGRFAGSETLVGTPTRTDTGVPKVHLVDSDGEAVAAATAAQARAQFIANLAAILGDARLIWLPAASDTTTSTDQSLNGRTLTHSTSLAARLSALGLGYAVSFDGTDEYAATPDADGLSFGNGTADSAVSAIVLANVTNTAAVRCLFSKFDNSSANEYRFQVAANDTVQLALTDGSVGVSPVRTSDAAITMGSWGLLGFTYSAATGGATAANDITLYENGLVKASTATNQGTYVAMENLGHEFKIGALAATETQFMSGSMALVALCQKALTASEHWALYQLCLGYFDFLD